MSCGCQNKKMAGEIERTRRLAKALAKIEGCIVGIYTNDDGTYGFRRADEPGNTIIEYISQH